jgi:uncharacterized pyridoxamine 5'-phosphate oxidase family protein
VTNSNKAVFKQLEANPKLELAATGADGTFLRVTGKALRISTEANKKLFLDVFPTLEPYYGGDNFRFLEVLAITDAVAEFQSLDAKRRKVEL